MNGIRLKSSFFASLLSLLFFIPYFRLGTLPEITKPYLGTYECTQAKLNDVDYLDRFSYIQLELKEKGEFVLYYREKNGEKKQEKGKYLYDEEKQSVRFIGGVGGCFKREFPLKEGILTVHIRIGEKNLLLTFKQK